MSQQLPPFIEYLRQRRVLNLVLVFVYGISLILFHDTVVQVSVKVMNNLSLPVYNQVVKWAVITLGISAALSLIYLLRKNKENRNIKLFFLIVTLGLAIFHFMVMLEMNIEMIHALEFMILAVLLFPLTGRFGAAIIWGLPFIFVNEWYQYQVLYPGYINYFEFNDIFLDLLGCGLAMIALWLTGAKSQGITSFFKRPELFFLMGVNVLFAIALLTCYFSMHTTTQCDNTWLVLSLLENPNQFWQTHAFTGAVYHVMNPIEGLLAMNLLCLFYMRMDDSAYTK